MIVHYNETLITLIQKKLKLYALYTVQGNKEKKMLVFTQIETIKETLARLNLGLDVNYQLFLATLHDLENNKTIEIDLWKINLKGEWKNEN